MLQNLPLCVILNPAGTYSYVGSIPRDLGQPAPASKSDVMGQRAYRGENGELLVTRFPVFKTEQDAIDHAAKHGHKVTV